MTISQQPLTGLTSDEAKARLAQYGSNARQRGETERVAPAFAQVLGTHALDARSDHRADMAFCQRISPKEGVRS